VQLTATGGITEPGYKVVGGVNYALDGLVTSAVAYVLEEGEPTELTYTDVYVWCDQTGHTDSIPLAPCNSPPPPPPPPQCCPYNFFNGTCTLCTSPVIFDVTGQGFFLTSAEDGVSFDISGSGTPVRLSWTASTAQNAFLALPGVDGLVHNGKQLFGNATPQPPSGHPNGFAALAVYDDPKNGGNGDGVIDSRDSVFASLRLWIDANHDGISQPEELHTLPSLGVNSISLNYRPAERRDENGNLFRYKSKVNPDDPDASSVNRVAYDVFFVLLNESAEGTATKSFPQGDKCPTPTSVDTGMQRAKLP
jgi:hypothetical protein